MVNYLDDIVGNVATALEDAGLWSNTLMVWSSDNGAAVELTTGMKNSYPLRGGYYTNWSVSVPLLPTRYNCDLYAIDDAGMAVCVRMRL